jgi:Fe-only nitrogenase accessory protein AnfO
MRIAAFVDTEGNTQSFESSGTVHIYEKKDDLQWRRVSVVPFCIEKTMNLKDIRKSIHTIAPSLYGCRAFITRYNMGIFNAIFEEELHIHIFSIEGSPLVALDKVRELIKLEFIEAVKRAESCKQQNNSTSPISVGDSTKGLYRINLVEVQKKNESMNSKEILVPFFEKNKFVELEIICLHTPKWIERELTDLNFTVKTEIRKDGFCHAFVYPGK